MQIFSIFCAKVCMHFCTRVRFTGPKVCRIMIIFESDEKIDCFVKRWLEAPIYTTARTMEVPWPKGPTGC